MTPFPSVRACSDSWSYLYGSLKIYIIMQLSVVQTVLNTIQLIGDTQFRRLAVVSEANLPSSAAVIASWAWHCLSLFIFLLYFLRLVFFFFFNFSALCRKIRELNIVRIAGSKALDCV
jgi:hypothetical protein